MTKPLLHSLFAITFIATLINVGIFGNSTMAAFFFFVLAASCLLIITGIFISRSKQQAAAINFIPFLWLSALVLWYFVQAATGVTFVSTSHIFILVCSMLLLGLTVSFNLSLLNIEAVFKIIVWLAAIESLLCLLQFAGVVKSLNEYLPVSGSWVNPNVTAIFLSLSIPAVLSIIIKATLQQRKIFIGLLVLVIPALLVLKCRTALIGAFVSAGMIASLHFRFANYIKSRLNTFQKILLASVCIVIVLSAGLFFYNAKKESAQGRQLVWKISTSIIKEKPLTGIGYGKFEQSYNFYQADYFANAHASDTEVANASYVHMAYNEWLQNAVEGGMPGLVLFTLFLLSLCFPLKLFTGSGNDITMLVARAGTVSFIAMSFINFTMQAVPAMVLFIIYAAVIGSKGKPIPNKKTYPAITKPAFGIALAIAGLFTFFSQMSVAIASATISNIAANRYDRQTAAELLESSQGKMETSDFYWNEYGKFLSRQKDYPGALDKFNKALQYSSQPSILVQKSNCLFRLKQYDSAYSTLQTVSNMMPNRLTPKYYLMKMYRQNNDTINMCRIANELIAMQPKGISPKAAQFKQEAQNILIAYKK